MEVQRDTVGDENLGKKEVRQRVGRGTGDGAGREQRNMELEERRPTLLAELLLLSHISGLGFQ